MKTVKVTYSNGATITTHLNGTPESIRQYFAIGRSFNLGNVADNVQQVAAVEVEEPVRKGLLVSVLRRADGDASNGGCSSKFLNFILTGPGVPEVFEPSEEAPELRLVPETSRGAALHATPADWVETKVWATFGGNFIYSSDSCFAGINNGAPIKIFDRME